MKAALGDVVDCASVQIYLIDLARNRASLEEAERGTPRLSAGDLARIQAFSHDEAAARNWRAARIGLRILLERSSAGEAARQADFVLGPHGRPALAGGHPHFSVSHSGGLALVAISDVGPIGIDLELPRSVAIGEPRRTRIVDAGRRLAGLPRLEGLAADDEFLWAWVRLEAAAKALGTGIGQMLSGQGVPDSRATATPQTIDLVVRDLEIPGGFGAVASQTLPRDLDVVPFPEITPTTRK